MKLNGWHRIGVVLSVLWAIVAFCWTRSIQVKNGHELFRSCLYKTTSYCENISLQSALDETANWTDVTFFSLFPIVIGWILAFLSVKVFKWIKTGFEKIT
jgi:hypothetical protein